MNKQGRPDILIVDDLAENLNLLCDVLHVAGYDVRPVPNGKLAIRAAEKQTPDLILLDINMPEMDGFEVCRILKKKPGLEQVPIIFISALAETHDKVKAFDAGGVDYVTKPFESKEVLARVKAHCELRRVQRELEEKNATLEAAFTDLKTAEVKLVQSEKMASLGVLTAGLAHEINNPINFVNSGVKGLVKVQADVMQFVDAYDRLCACSGISEEEIANLKRDTGYLGAQEAMEELTGSILTGVQRTCEIIEGLRIFARPDDQDKKMVRIDGIMDSALMLLQNRTEQGVRVLKKYGDVPMILCHPGRINQVFVNLLSNAIDAVKTVHHPNAVGEIRISTQRKYYNGKNGILVSVTDNGSGMSTDVRDHIFEPFFTTKDVGKGVGLGLSISHGIIEEHGGYIGVATDVDQGTEFSVWIPLQAISNGGEQ